MDYYCDIWSRLVEYNYEPSTEQTLVDKTNNNNILLLYLFTL